MKPLSVARDCGASLPSKGDLFQESLFFAGILMRHIKVSFGISWFIAFSFSFLPIAFAQLQLGERVPEFATWALNGKRIALQEYLEQKGTKALVLSFFATWCQPCKEDLKYLQKIQDQYGAYGFRVLAILTPDSFREDWVPEFMQNLKVGLPVIFDEDGVIARRYGVFELPYNFLIDKEGILQGRYLGYNESVKHDFESRLRKLLQLPEEGGK